MVKEPAGKLTDVSAEQPLNALLRLVRLLPREPDGKLMEASALHAPNADAIVVSALLPNAPDGKVIDASELQLLKVLESVVTLASEPEGNVSDCSERQVLKA